MSYITARLFHNGGHIADIMYGEYLRPVFVTLVMQHICTLVVSTRIYWYTIIDIHNIFVIFMHHICSMLLCSTMIKLLLSSFCILSQFISIWLDPRWPVRLHTSLRGRHYGRDSVSHYQPHQCLLNHLFRRRSKKTSKLRVTGLCVGNSPHKWPVTRKMSPFDDVIMIQPRGNTRARVILIRNVLLLLFITSNM